MRRVCICENVHFRFIYTLSLREKHTPTTPHFFQLFG